MRLAVPQKSQSCFKMCDPQANRMNGVLLLTYVLWSHQLPEITCQRVYAVIDNSL